MLQFWPLTSHLLFASTALRYHDSADGSELSSLEDVKSCTEPVEVRASNNASVRPPPGPKGLPLVGNHYEIYPDPLGNYDRLFSRYGPVIKTTNMGTTTYHTNDPEIARHVLREGEFFTKTTSDPSHPLFYMQLQSSLFTCDSDSPAFPIAHKFIPPALSPRAVAHHLPLVQESARSIFPVLDQLADRDLAFNVYHYMFKLAGQVIWRVVVGQDLDHFKALNTPPATTIQLFGEFLSLMKKTSLRPKWYGSLPFGDPARLRVVQQMLWDNVEKAINESTTTEGEALPLSDPTSSLRASSVADFLSRARDNNGERLPQDILIPNVVVLLGAGFTTSASLLSWALYSLVMYPGNQERLLQELVDHGEDGKRVWTYEEVHALRFLDCFVKETQRMHSPSFQTARNAKQNVVLPGGYLIPKGSVVIPCFPSLHKNPAHWDNPTMFNADRWAEEGTSGNLAKKGVYIPFAAGRRGCVGLNLALLEVKMVLIQLVYHYRFEDSSPEAVVYDPEFLVTRPVNFYASTTRRTEWPSPSEE
ncbi:cytochrome P450 [Colletotrichum spaethianum]|uniref:Cytochrome P450 n=1 Tax=Colletotrichum spaethianum TaxID=700344 RepID=A0AA37UR85_9PEZI|nr:cytochrome P450 [Colletotrichum spaethianum]GKT47553.1 cytochrome P450 [Colletotrichum spaethianum]